MSLFPIQDISEKNNLRWLIVGLLMVGTVSLVSGATTVLSFYVFDQSRNYPWVDWLALPVAAYFAYSAHCRVMEGKKKLIGKDFEESLYFHAIQALSITVSWLIVVAFLRLILPAEELTRVLWTGLGVAVGGAVLVSILRSLLAPNRESVDQTWVLRGQKLEVLPPPPTPLPGYTHGQALIGGKALTPTLGTFAALGQSRSGKTLALLTYLRSQIISPTGELTHRCFMFDPKGDFHRRLLSWLIPASQITTLNPWSPLSSAWDIARDSENAELEIAAVLIALKDSKRGDFFDKGALLFVASVMAYFNVFAKRNWDLRDFVEAIAAPPEVLEHIIESTPLGRQLIDKVVSFQDKSDDRQSMGIFGTVIVELGNLREVAYLWHP